MKEASANYAIRLIKFQLNQRIKFLFAHESDGYEVEVRTDELETVLKIIEDIESLMNSEEG